VSGSTTLSESLHLGKAEFIPFRNRSGVNAHPAPPPPLPSEALGSWIWLALGLMVIVVIWWLGRASRR
jgi:hypothetical protein